MKTTLLNLFAFCVLASAAMSAQLMGSYIDPQAHPLVFASHQQHAYEGSLLPQTDLYVRTATTIVQGEKPLWECVDKTREMPLGDVARLFRQQHATAKKAVMVLEK